MTTKIGWQFSDRRFSFGQLQSGDFPDPITPFERTCLEFGHAWLNGIDPFFIETSGSTGTPKQITIHHAQMEASARLTEKALGLQSGDTALLCLNIHSIAGQMMLVRSLVTGMNIIAIDPTANPWDHLNADLSIDFAALVPYQLLTILNSASATKKLNVLKTVIVGGAPISEKLKALIVPLNCQVYATYGMTETISHIALQKLNGKDKKDYFQVLPGITIQTDLRGCLIIAANYLGSEKIVTNDLVEILSPQQFRWLGRIDNVINTGGIKVIPEKIESVVESTFDELGLQNRFFISGMADPSLGSKVVLIIEGLALDIDLTRGINERLSDRLTRYETPKEIRAIEHFVQTEAQKINRTATIQLLK